MAKLPAWARTCAEVARATFSGMLAGDGDASMGPPSVGTPALGLCSCSRRRSRARPRRNQGPGVCREGADGCPRRSTRRSSRFTSVPMISSRFLTRRPIRLSPRMSMKPRWENHQKRSRPSTRCGSTRPIDETDSRTRRPLPASSSAICTPVLPAPTTRISPMGSCSGRRYPVLCSWGTPGSRPDAKAGVRGVWNAPAATTTRAAV